MISLIVAYDKNYLIGKNGKMPWHLPEELLRFKRITMNKTVIMGRKTFEAIGKVLEDRENIVITRNENFNAEGVVVVQSLNEAIQQANNDIFIIGGAQIYKEALPIVDQMYITELDAEFKGDTYFPEVKWDQFQLIKSEKVDGEIPYEFKLYQRR